MAQLSKEQRKAAAEAEKARRAQEAATGGNGSGATKVVAAKPEQVETQAEEVESEKLADLEESPKGILAAAGNFITGLVAKKGEATTEILPTKEAEAPKQETAKEAEKHETEQATTEAESNTLPFEEWAAKVDKSQMETNDALMGVNERLEKIEQTQLDAENRAAGVVSKTTRNIAVQAVNMAAQEQIIPVLNEIRDLLTAQKKGDAEEKETYVRVREALPALESLANMPNLDEMRQLAVRIERDRKETQKAVQQLLAALGKPMAKVEVEEELVC